MDKYHYWHLSRLLDCGCSGCDLSSVSEAVFNLILVNRGLRKLAIIRVLEKHDTKHMPHQEVLEFIIENMRGVYILSTEYDSGYFIIYIAGSGDDETINKARDVLHNKVAGLDYVEDLNRLLGIPCVSKINKKRIILYESERYRPILEFVCDCDDDHDDFIQRFRDEINDCITGIKSGFKLEYMAEEAKSEHKE